MGKVGRIPHQPRAVERQPWVKATSCFARPLAFASTSWLPPPEQRDRLESFSMCKKDCCLKKKKKDQSEPRPKPMQPISGLEATLLPPDCLLQKTNQRNPKGRRNLIEFRQGESRSPQGRRHCMNVTRTVPIRSLPFISAGVSTSSEGLESFS